MRVRTSDIPLFTLSRLIAFEGPRVLPRQDTFEERRPRQDITSLRQDNRDTPLVTRYIEWPHPSACSLRISRRESNAGYSLINTTLSLPVPEAPETVIRIPLLKRLLSLSTGDTST